MTETAPSLPQWLQQVTRYTGYTRLQKSRKGRWVLWADLSAAWQANEVSHHPYASGTVARFQHDIDNRDRVITYLQQQLAECRAAGQFQSQVSSWQPISPAPLTLVIHRLRRAVDKVLKTARLGEYEGQTKNDHELIDAARDLLALTAEEKAVAPAEEEI